jgi:hypothetical protein
VSAGAGVRRRLHDSKRRLSVMGTTDDGDDGIVKAQPT